MAALQLPCSDIPLGPKHKQVKVMPLVNFLCSTCKKQFAKILSSSDTSSVICPACDNGNIRTLYLEKNNLFSRKSQSIPAGALAGGSCKPGFS